MSSMQNSILTETYTSPKLQSNYNPNRGRKGYAYKQSSYQYSTNNDNLGTTDKFADQNIDQLDALLEDLKNERKTTRKEILKTSTGTNSYGADVFPPESMLNADKSVLHKFEDNRSKLKDNISSSSYITKSYNFNDQSSMSSAYSQNEPKTARTTSVYPNTFDSQKDMFSNSCQRMVSDFESMNLSEDILPKPGTKVTTTVRTYTYEVPSEPLGYDTIRNQKTNNINYSNVQNERINNISGVNSIGRSSVPDTVTYNTESYSTYEKRNNVPSKIEDVTNRTELNTYYPKDSLPHKTTKTIHYNVNKVETEDVGKYPKPSDNFDQNNYTYNPMVPNASNQPTTNRYYFKESTNVINKYHDNVPPNDPYRNELKPVDGRYPHGSTPVDGRYPNGPNQNPSTVIYKYTSTTTNTKHGSPEGIPPPFPINGDDMVPVANPPQRVEELMESFGNADAVDKPSMQTPLRRREIETAVASTEQPQIVPSVNRVGKDVYYPPGHTMKMESHELQAGSSAGGRWAKGSGMYEYESGSRSKSKTKTKGAMVPVCLPLCCAMPCSIM